MQKFDPYHLGLCFEMLPSHILHGNRAITDWIPHNWSNDLFSKIKFIQIDLNWNDVWYFAIKYWYIPFQNIFEQMNHPNGRGFSNGDQFFVSPGKIHLNQKWKKLILYSKYWIRVYRRTYRMLSIHCHWCQIIEKLSYIVHRVYIKGLRKLEIQKMKWVHLYLCRQHRPAM